MVRKLTVALTLLAIAAMPLALAECARAGEYRVQTIKDRHGIKQGTIEQRPDGQVVIKDRWGIKQGTIETKGDDVIVKDRYGLPPKQEKRR